MATGKERQKQIPCGNDNRKSRSKNNGKGNGEGNGGSDGGSFTDG